MDILRDGKYIPLEYELKEIPQAAVWDPILVKGSQWACVKEEDVKRKMEKIVKSYSKPKEWARELAERVKTKFDLKKVNEEFITVIKQSLMRSVMDQIDPIEHLKSFIDTQDAYCVLFTMPRSHGDVLVSTRSGGSS